MTRLAVCRSERGGNLVFSPRLSASRASKASLLLYYSIMRMAGYVQVTVVNTRPGPSTRSPPPQSVYILNTSSKMTNTFPSGARDGTPTPLSGASGGGKAGAVQISAPWNPNAPAKPPAPGKSMRRAAKNKKKSKASSSSPGGVFKSLPINTDVMEKLVTNPETGTTNGGKVTLAIRTLIL
ncbi:hypothetical protein M3J09_009139 [Ascochyta lentis]